MRAGGAVAVVMVLNPNVLPLPLGRTVRVEPLVVTVALHVMVTAGVW
nr:hypothetical protein Ade03nite_01450 [Actinoplanes derwentensis]